MKSKNQNFGMVGRDILPHLRQVEKIATRKKRIDNALVIVGLFFVTVADRQVTQLHVYISVFFAWSMG